jgi:serine/threonine protein kinase
MSADEVLIILSKIRQYHTAWAQFAKKDGLVKAANFLVDRHSNRATCYIYPNGRIIVFYKVKPFARGTSKFVSVLLSFKPGSVAEDPVSGGGAYSLGPTLIAGMSAVNSDAELEHEVQIYRRIQEYSHTLLEGEVLDGLSQAEGIRLPSGQLWLVQQLYDGDLDTNRELLADAKRGLPILYQVARGLFHLHSMGLVHGDLKNSNLLFNRDDSSVVISDFGLTSDPMDKITPRTTAGFEPPEMIDQEFLIKLPTNAHPEQISLVQKRDIYSFGMIAISAAVVNQKPKMLLASQMRFKACQRFFLGYFSGWGGYGRCMQKQAHLIQAELKALAQKACLPDTLDFCPEAIIADSLSVNPVQRPTAGELVRRLKLALEFL